MTGEWRDFGGKTDPYWSHEMVVVICPCGGDVSVWRWEDEDCRCEQCGREYKAEFSVRVYVRATTDTKETTDGH